MTKLSTLNIILAAAFAAGAVQAQTPGIDMNGVVGYVIDQRGNVAKSGTGLCWRTGYWTPAMAIAECDPDLARKEEPKPMMAAPTPVMKAPPAPAVAPKVRKVTLAADALFDFDKSQLRPQGMAKLDKLVNSLRNIKLEVIIAVGHADRLGGSAYNQTLSEHRANTVKHYLVGKGVDANRIYAEGKGEMEPVTGGKCGSSTRKTMELINCLQPDRRVDIEVIGTQTVR